MSADHVRHFSENIGSRPPASRGERRAAHYVKEQLQRLGYDASTEIFPALKTAAALHAFHCALCVSAWVWLLKFPIISFALCLIGLASLALESAGLTGLSALIPKSRSINAVAFRVPRRPSIYKVIVVAHLDSSPAASIPLWRATIENTRNIYFLTAIALIATFAASIAVPTDWDLWIWIAIGALNAPAVVAALALIAREIGSRDDPRVADNATGVAAMLGVAEAFADEKLKYTELEFLGSGAKESGRFGIKNHLSKNWHDASHTLVLNLDNAGAGPLHVTVREGTLIKKETDEALLGFALGFSLPSTGKPPGAAVYTSSLTDAYAALARGFRAISIMGVNPDGGLGDPTQSASEDALSDAAALAVHIINEIEKEGKAIAGKSS